MNLRTSRRIMTGDSQEERLDSNLLSTGSAEISILQIQHGVKQPVDEWRIFNRTIRYIRRLRRSLSSDADI